MKKNRRKMPKKGLNLRIDAIAAAQKNAEIKREVLGTLQKWRKIADPEEYEEERAALAGWRKFVSAVMAMPEEC
jgi:hypothetical protein